MTQFIITRRRAINDRGRTMTLRRLLTANPTTVSDVAVKGYLAMFTAEQIGTGNILQGDGTVSILNDEIAAAAWPGPPRPRDQMIIDGRTWTIQGSDALYEGAVCIGHTILVRGG